MLSKLSALIQKIPGWILLLAGLASIDGQYVVNLFVAMHLPKEVQYTKDAIALLLFLGAYIKQSEGLKTANELKAAAVATAAKVATAISIMLCMGGIAVSTGGCPQGVPNNTVQTVLTAEQYACVLDQVVNGILPDGPVAQVAAAIQQACADKIPQGLTALIVDILNAFIARQPEAGPAPQHRFGKHAWLAPGETLHERDRARIHVLPARVFA